MEVEELRSQHFHLALPAGALLVVDEVEQALAEVGLASTLHSLAAASRVVPARPRSKTGEAAASTLLLLLQ